MPGLFTGLPRGWRPCPLFRVPLVIALLPLLFFTPIGSNVFDTGGGGRSRKSRPQMSLVLLFLFVACVCLLSTVEGKGLGGVGPRRALTSSEGHFCSYRSWGWQGMWGPSGYLRMFRLYRFQG